MTQQLSMAAQRILALLAVWTLLALPAAYAQLAGQTSQPTAVAEAAAAPAAGQPLATLLNPDGSLKTNTGFSGSVDTSGWQLTSGPHGEPRFVPASATAAGDEQWDDRFGDPGATDKITAMALGPDGSVYIGGRFTTIGGVEAKRIARWDGYSWQALGSGLDDQPEQMAFLGTTLYVAGPWIKQAGGVVVNQLASWNGTAWSRVGNGTGPEYASDWGSDPGTIDSLAILDGEVYVGGYFNRIDGVAANGIARWNGSGWSALGTGIGNLDGLGNFVPDGRVLTLLAADNKLYAGGKFEIAGGLSANGIAVWDGAAWSTLGSGLKDTSDAFERAEVNAIVVDGGVVYAGGKFNQAGGLSASNVAAWNGTAWSALGDGVQGENWGSTSPVSALAVYGGNLYVGGDFLSAGGQAIPSLAMWNGTSWSDAGAALQAADEVLAVLVTPEGLHVGGYMSVLAGRTVNNVALLSNGEWLALGFGLQLDHGSDMPGKQYAIAVDAAGRVYVGGNFKRAGGVPVNNIAMWDGRRWYPLAEGINGTVYALAAAGTDLYVAGDFTQAGTVSASRVARWNGTSWSALGNGVNGQAYALAYADGRLYVGGNFTSAGTVAAFDVAYWENNQWHAFGNKLRIYEISKEGGEVGTNVYALAVSGSQVFVAGSFQTLHVLGTDATNVGNYRLVNNVVGWDRVQDDWFLIGKQTAAEEPGVTTNGYTGFGTEVRALEVVGNQLYIGGDFNQAGTQAVGNLARWDLAARQWSPITGVAGFDTDGLYPTIIRDFNAIGDQLFVAGHFLTAGEVAARYIALLDTGSDTWSTLGSGVAWYNDRFTYVYAVAATPTAIYIGGDFKKAGGKTSSGFGSWMAPGTSGVVTPASGGTLNGPNGTTLQVPDGAVTSDTGVTLTEQFAPEAGQPIGQTVVRSLFVSARTVAGQPVSNFGKSYTLRLPYSAGDLGGRQPSALNVLHWNGNAWVPLLPCQGCGIDTANGVITVATNQAGEFAVVLSSPTTYTYIPLLIR